VKINGRGKQLHRLIIEENLGRPLLRTEFVHHKDGNGLNNALDNLEVLTAKQHSMLHNQKHPVVYLCATCGKPFTPHKTKRGRQKNCTRECFRKYQQASHGHYVPQHCLPFFAAIAETMRMVAE